MTTMEQLREAKAACQALARASTAEKNQALQAMAAALEAHEAEILSENAWDMDAARGKISEVMLDRLALNHDRIAGMAEGIRQVASPPMRRPWRSKAATSVSCAAARRRSGPPMPSPTRCGRACGRPDCRRTASI